MADALTTDPEVEGAPEEKGAASYEPPSLSTRVEWFEAWEEQTGPARDLSRRDREYYDNKQWTQDEIDVLKERNQPVLTKNRIARKINFILGEEIRKRIDPRALPRTVQHEDAARAATDALRYVEEEQNFDTVRSAVFKDVLISGYGGAIKTVEQDEDEQYKHVLQHVEWDRLFWDPHSRAPDFGDAKYLGVVVWMDLDDASRDFPDAEEALRSAVAESNWGANDTTEDVPRKWADHKRQRVKVVEMYCRVGPKWFRSVFTRGADITEPEECSLRDEKGRHGVCPLVMLSCYVDGEGQRYGVVRALISPQDEINKRSSKALHILSMRQVIAEKDTITDPQKFQTELAKPDGFAEVNVGRLTDQTVRINNTSDLAQGQVMLLQEAKADIDSIGPSSSTLPELPNSSSGRAFLARQQAASQELGSVFDELRAWSKRVFTLDWLGVRQYWTDEMWLRVSDDRELNGWRFVALNRQTTRFARLQELMQRQPPLTVPQALAIATGTLAQGIIAEVQWQHQQMQSVAQAQGLPPPQGPVLEQQMMGLLAQHPAMQEPVTVNQVEGLLVDIIIDEAPDTAVLADEHFETLGELTPAVIQARQDLAPLMLKTLIKASRLPNKRELLEAFDKPPDPAAQQAAQQAQQIQMAAAQANVASLQARAQRDQAEAAKAAAEAQRGPEGLSPLEAAQAQKVALEAQLVVPATAHREHAQAAKLEAETRNAPAAAQRDLAQANKAATDADARQFTAPAEARRAHAQAQKAEAETTMRVIVAVPEPGPGSIGGGMGPMMGGRQHGR